MPVPLQTSLGLEVPALVELPETVSACRGAGICPKFGCQFNVVLHVTKNRLRGKGKRRKPSTETINIGGRGGKGKGESLATRRTMRKRVREEDMDRMTAAAVDACDRLPSTCTLDYCEDSDLVTARRPDGPAVHMTLDQIGRVLRVTREAVRKILESAIAKVKESPHFADWMELVLERAAMKARKEPILPAMPEKRSKWAELDAAIEESMRRIEQAKRGARMEKA